MYVWTINDLFEYLDFYLETEKKNRPSTTGEVSSPVNDIERF
jgi:hypothetical protein